MKCNLYGFSNDAATQDAEVKAATARVDVSGSDEAKAALTPDELAALSSLTGFDCQKAAVKLGTLKEDTKFTTIVHAKGDKVLLCEVSNGVKLAVFPVSEQATTEEERATNDLPPVVPPIDDRTASAGNAPAAPDVIIPPAPTV